jgi:hypothetical protein
MRQIKIEQESFESEVFTYLGENVAVFVSKHLQDATYFDMRMEQQLVWPSLLYIGWHTHAY